MLSQRKTFAGCWLPHHRSLAGENENPVGKPTFPRFLFDGTITIRNGLSRKCFIPLNGLNGQIELLSFTTVPYDYYGPSNYVVASGSLDRGIDSGLRKESPDETFILYRLEFEIHRCHMYILKVDNLICR